MHTPLIALLTDFGMDDSYVGVMKGVISGICPDARIIDLTHAIAPQNVRQGAFELLTTYTYFPADTIFLVVVDPGVGGTRRPMLARAGTYTFIAPDNGVLSYVLDRDPAAQVHELTSAQHRLSRVSNTFHGRDVFAPAAAYLARGGAPEVLGPRLESYVRLPQPRLVRDDKRIRGEAVHVDHFGNIVTSIGNLTWTHEGELALHSAWDAQAEAVRIDAKQAVVTYDDWRINGIARTYTDVPRGSLLALVGSSGFLEIAINQGDACAQLSAGIGFEFDLQLG
ncbi:MAG: SAM-dependent chlorinase/fluorinase [Chloroflexota bacterium]|nr:SAM-dependent chlorinase/fluorinase [Chloroflexota bacterium]